MADKKISALNPSTTPLAGTEVLPIVQSGSTVKVSVADLTAGRDVAVTSITTGLGAVGTPAYTFASDTNTGIYSPTGDTIAFVEGGVEAMRIDSSGNVGIGTSAPAAKLEVAGQVRSTTGTGFKIVADYGDYRMTTVNGRGWRMGTTSNGTNLGDFYIQGSTDDFTTSFINSVYVNSSGNVGVNQTPNASQGRVQINQPLGSSINGALRLTDNATTSFVFNNISSGLSALWSSGALAFGTASDTFTERMRIDASGNLLVGKSSLANVETTDGAILYKAASGGGMTAYFTNGGNGTAMAVSTQVNTNAVIFYRSGTQVGSIGVTSSATSYNTSSDYRLKEIDGPIANSGAYIDALNPVQGSWKADGSRFIGLLAHEVQEVSETPIATGEKDGEKMQAMDYSAPELIANLIAELQSVRARLAQLEGN